MIGGAMQIGIIIAIIFAAVWGLILLGFYIWGWMYLRKEPSGIILVSPDHSAF